MIVFQRILLAWDGSELALFAFDASIEVARRYDAEIVAISIAHSRAHAETSADRIETADAARRYLKQTFDDVADRAVRAGVDVSHEIIDGASTYKALRDYAHAHGFDLIICGHHRTHRAGRLLLHGITEALIEGPTPVLVITDGTA